MSNELENKLKPCPFEAVETIAEFTKNEISDVKAFLGAAKACGFELINTEHTRAAQQPTGNVNWVDIIESAKECVGELFTAAYDFDKTEDQNHHLNVYAEEIQQVLSQLAKALSQQPAPKAVDVEGLKKEIPQHPKKCMADIVNLVRKQGEATGWNDCIDHLAAQGYLQTPNQEFAKAHEEGRLKYRNDLTGKMEVVPRDNAEAVLLLKNLCEAEEDYRKVHDVKGAGHIATGRAWDHMRKTANKCRKYIEGDG